MTVRMQNFPGSQIRMAPPARTTRPNFLNTIEHTGRQALSLNHWKTGAGDGDRTRDIQLGKLAFYR